MNNQRGEATLFCILILVALSGLLTLCGLELQSSFQTLKKRTSLFLCVKESKGELKLYIEKMGRLNWALDNISKAQLVALFIPPLWPYLGSADKIKKGVKTIQAMSLAPYLFKIKELKGRGCPIDPQMLMTPYVLGNDFAFARTKSGAAILRNPTWTYYFLKKPYLLTLEVDGTSSNSLHPRIRFQAEEKLGTLSSLLSSR